MMKNVLKLLTLTAIALIFSFKAQAAPLNMVLTYGGEQHNYNAESIELKVNGNSITLTEMPPIILNSRTYVPSREVFEPLGALVDWKTEERTLYIAYDSTLIVLKPDSREAVIDGSAVVMDNPPIIINNKLMIPVRFVAESLNIPVDWDGDNRIVFIGSDPSSIEADDAPVLDAPIEDALPEAVNTAPPEAYTPPPSAAVSTDISPAPLTEAEGGEINVTAISAEGQTYTISASGPITKVEKTVLAENKLVLDFYGANNGLLGGAFTYSGFPGVSAVRSSQFQTEPVKITRVVFDFAGANIFSVSMSDDRHNIYVRFDSNVLKDVYFENTEAGDKFTFVNSLAATVKATRLTSPARLALDIPSTKNGVSFSEQIIAGRFVSGMTVSQLDDTTVRVLLDLTSLVEFSVQKTDADSTEVSVIVSAPAFSNVDYSQSPSVITLLGVPDINPDLIVHTDDYLDKIYRLTLPGNYAAHFGSGVFTSNDSIIESISIVNNEAGNTEIIIKETSTYAYIVTKQEDKILITAVNPKQAYKTVVYLDAGHGARDGGASGGGFKEKDLNLGIMLKLYNMLENDPDIKVYASRLSDVYPENAARAKNANLVADLFVSIHHNSSDSRSAAGTEVLYLNHEGEAYPAISSEAVARIFQTNLVAAMGTKDRGVVKRPDLIVLNQTTIPAVLVEVAFLSNSGDLAKVSTDAGRQIAAEAMYKSIKEVFNQYPTGR